MTSAFYATYYCESSDALLCNLTRIDLDRQSLRDYFWICITASSIYRCRTHATLDRYRAGPRSEFWNPQVCINSELYGAICQALSVRDFLNQHSPTVQGNQLAFCHLSILAIVLFVKSMPRGVVNDSAFKASAISPYVLPVCRSSMTLVRKN